MEIRGRRRRLMGLFQRREDATAAAHDLEDRGAAARVADAGLLEDAAMARRTFRGLALGVTLGVLLGLAVGLGAMAAHWHGWPAIMGIAAVAGGAFGAVAGSQVGAAAAEQTRSSGQAMAVVADVPADAAPGTEQTLREHGAASVEETDL